MARDRSTVPSTTQTSASRLSNIGPAPQWLDPGSQALAETAAWLPRRILCLRVGGNLLGLRTGHVVSRRSWRASLGIPDQTAAGPPGARVRACPRAVGDKMLGTVRRFLPPRGVLFACYNAFPGCRRREMAARAPDDANPCSWGMHRAEGLGCAPFDIVKKFRSRMRSGRARGIGQRDHRSSVDERRSPVRVCRALLRDHLGAPGDVSTSSQLPDALTLSKLRSALAESEVVSALCN